jgi:hypothetical protein
MPHNHPEDRVYTVISGISGIFYIGVGDQFDAEKLHAYPPSAVIILPGNIPVSLGEIWRVHHAGDGHGTARPGTSKPEDDPRNAPQGCKIHAFR